MTTFVRFTIMKKIIILLNVVLVLLWFFASIANFNKVSMSYAYVRDQIIGPNKCLAYLPEGVYYSNRIKSELPYLIFSFYVDSVEEKFIYVVDSLQLDDVHDFGEGLNIENFKKKSFYEPNLKDYVDQFCYENGKKCFIASKTSALSKNFASKLDSISTYVQCFGGIKNR